MEAVQELVLDNAKIKTEKLTLYYGGFKALEDINLTIPDKQVTAIIGPSGCGKSSLVRTINRLVELAPQAKVEGQVYIDDQPVYDDSIDVVALRTNIGYIFQKPNPFPASIYDNVAFGPRLQGKRQRELDDIVELTLKHAALWDEVKGKLHQSALNLSGGQQQRLCIARALAVNPQILLMDEPCSALDPASTQRIEDLVHHLKNELAIVIVTHNMQQAARVSNYTAFLLSESGEKPGRLIEFGPTSQIFTRPACKKTEDFITGRFG